MSEPLPNCPLCDEDMNLEGGPKPDKAWCSNHDCALDLVSLPLAALVRLAALRKPLNVRAARALVNAHREAVMASTESDASVDVLASNAAGNALRAALTGKR